MSPLGIENALKTAGRLIGQACVIGDDRRFNVALLVLDADATRAWAANQGRGVTDLATLIEDRRLLDEVAQEVAAANERLSRVEHVRRWRILPTDWLPDGEELTPTMKLTRCATTCWGSGGSACTLREGHDTWGRDPRHQSRPVRPA